MKLFLFLTLCVIVLLTVSAYAQDKPAEETPDKSLNNDVENNHSATENLNPDLLPFYKKVTNGRGSELIGKKINLTLKLKYDFRGSLLFSDTRIRVDNNTRYYFVKWNIPPEIKSNFTGKAGVYYDVKGRISDVVTGSFSGYMPYIVVDITSINL